MNDETGSEVPEPVSGMPDDVGTPARTASFLTGVRGVIRTLAYVALMLVLAVAISRAMQFVMGLLGVAAG